MKKIISSILLALLAISLLSSCEDDNKIRKTEYTLTVASVERIMFIADHHSPYYVKQEGKSRWENFPYIYDFQHQEGYEYVIRIKEVYDKSKEDMIGGSPYSFYMLEEISKTKKDSKNIPSQQGWITIASKGTGDKDYPYYALDHNKGDWTKFAPIKGFEYEEGYEYAVIVNCKYNGVDAKQKYTYTYEKTARKDKDDRFVKPK